ncbi:hypothetical protein N7493_006971 [Penicillium malachiteum]|uniref:Uncharacterized protein n=1 Tax=Penicillium malachiteum TaxID=1324776 RepID=A0AAD6HJS2_9EURO|nr:hypothetical protein N7493_006971 [Penicillium malachiteum]
MAGLAEEIEDSLPEFSSRIQQQGIQVLTLGNASESQSSTQIGPIENGQMDSDLIRVNSVTLERPTISEENMETASFALAQDDLMQSTEYLEAIGISSNEFLAIVDEISTQDLSYRIWDPQTEWLTGTDPMSWEYFTS